MTKDHHSESIIVIGSGIVGIGCAAYLNDAGYKVTVIEQNKIAQGCSKSNCGYISPSHVLPLTEPAAIGIAIKSLLKRDAPFRVKPRFDPALWNWMVQFARRCNERQMLRVGQHLKAILDSSLSEYKQLMENGSIDCQWRESGMLYVLQTDGGLKKFSETEQILAEHFGVSAKHIGGEDLPDFDPALRSGLAGGFFYPEDASLRPDRLNLSWTKLLRERGVNFVEECRFVRSIKGGGRIKAIETSTGTLDADLFLVATGAWSSRIGSDLGLKIPVQPGKGYSVTMSRPDPCPSYPMLFPEHKIGVSPFQDGYRLGSMMEFAGFDTKIPKHRIDQLRRSAEPYLVSPYSNSETETERWFGWRPMTWDSMPIIGRVPHLENAFLATGHNMLGLSMSPATGRLITEMISGTNPHIDPKPYAPDRF